MIKNFQELRKIDVLPFSKKLDGSNYNYLPWVDCLLLLRENGAGDVQYNMKELIQVGPTALVRVSVGIDDVFREIVHPVSFGDSVIYNPTATQIAVAIQRAMVKCVAINWGLGISLWAESDNDNTPVVPDNKLGAAITMAIDAKRQERGFTTPDGILKLLGADRAFIARLISEGSPSDQLAFLEKINNLTSDPF